MLARYLCRISFLFADKKIIKRIVTSHNSNSAVDNRKSDSFRIKLKKINDPTYFMQIINNDHSLHETNKLLHAISSGGSGIGKQNFQTIFKKYCYYIEKIPQKKGYTEANENDKLAFLDGVTQIYAKMGNLANAHMVKTFNRVSDQLFKSFIEAIKYQRQEDMEKLIENMALVLVSIARFNKKKAMALFKTAQKYLSSQRCLIKITVESSINYLQLFNLIFSYNRLIVQTCIDALRSQIHYIPFDSYLKVVYSLASSQYPINKAFTLQLIKRMQKEFQKNIDPNTGHYHALNAHSLRQNIRMLESLSLIEVNMNLASAYLPELTSVYQLEMFEISAYLGRMGDRQLRNYCHLMRRICYYDGTLLKELADQLLKREILELQDLSALGQNENQNKTKKDDSKYMRMDTFASGLHALAVYNYRSQPLMEYFIKTIELLKNKYQFDRQNLKLNGKQGQNEQKQRYLFHPKFYGRIIWSMCVLGTKQQISKVYSIFQTFFQSEINTFPIHDSLNFYYCYLLLKAYFPKSPLTFQSLLQHLQSQHLDTQISQTHLKIYNTFISAGIAALKQHNISNLLCDIFIPRYESSDEKYLVANVVVDVHGYHHFMRNGHQLKGGSVLKAKILQEEGYLYQYVSVEEWVLADDKEQFVKSIMDNIAKKFGEKINKKAVKELQQGASGKVLSVSPRDSPKQQIGEEMKSIPFRQGRHIKTNSLKLQSKLSQNKKNQI